MYDEFKGRNAIVTGGGSGLGRAICKRLAREGVNIAVADINLKGAEETVEQLAEFGVKAIAVECDVTKEAAVEAMAKTASEAFGKIDFLVNNAGIGTVGPFLDMDEELTDWYRTQSIDLNGLAHMSYYIGRHMRDNGYGKVINISSNAADMVNAECMSAYAAAKAAVNRLTKCLAYEWGQYGINVNAIAPGFTHSNLAAAMPPEAVEHVCRKMATGRMGEAIEIGALAVYLASPASDQVTGAVVTIDGGYSLAI